MKHGVKTWTRSQLKAIHSGSSDICVVAAAGSGKTGVLVERFVQKVLAGADPGELIAITYTRSAGEQLKEKIHRRLAGSGRAAGALGAVGTIHGFCARLLQEHAIDAGLDPAFRVLEGEALKIFEARGFEEWMEGLSAEPGAALPTLLAEMTLGDFRRDLRAVYARWRSMGRGRTPSPSTAAAGRAAALVRGLGDLLDGCCRRSADAGRSDFAAVPGMPAEGTSLDDRLLWLGAVRDAAVAFKRPRAHAEEGAALIAAAAALADAWADIDSGSHTRSFTALLSDFDRFYAARKRAEALLDTEDLLEETLALFGREGFGERFRGRYRALLVDEYQDVNDLQSRLLEKMGEGLEVFTVGDARQSIYRFRYAECRHLIDRSRPAAGRERIDLEENFRSRAGILAWINGVLSGVRYHDELPFGELKATREAADGTAVELLLERPAEKIAREEASALQARRIADRIARLVSEDGFTPGDIAVLFRGMRHAGILEEELRSRGIRFHSQRKRGFWDQIEVRDQLSLLYLLRNPSDRFWAAAVLRSPWAGLDDDALHRILGVGTPAADGTDEAASEDWRSRLETETGLEARHFVRWFDHLARTACAEPVRRVLAGALEISGYGARTLAAPDGAARMANVRKLLELSAEAERMAGGGITDFLRHAEELEDEGADRGEAALAGERTDAVRILSVHSSKGLEFPVVIVWGVDQENARQERGRFFLTQEAEVVKKFRHDLPIKLDPTGAAYASHRADEEERDDRESRRLFYVALTRARERLILCGTLQPPPKSGKSSADEKFGWMSFIQSRLPGLREAAPGPVGTGGELCVLHGAHPPAAIVPSAPPPLSGPVGRFEDRSRPYRQTLDLAVTSVVGRPDPGKVEIPDALLWGGTVESGEWAAEGAEWEEWQGTASGPEALPPALPGDASVFGVLLHGLLQHVDLALEPAAAVEAAAGRVRHLTDPASLERAREQALRFLESAVGQDLRKSAAAGRPVFRETPFLYRVRAAGEELGFLRGQIDLLFEAPDGKWTLVDYKTSAAHRPEYDDQTRWYAHGLRRLLNGRPHRALLFYTAAGETRETDLTAAGTDGFESELAARYQEASAALLAGR
jgi:ATP-dependent helicase/nuclease subunit A